MLLSKKIQKRNLNTGTKFKSDEEWMDLLEKLTHVRLDRENITRIENLESLKSVTNLYLQHNHIQVIENLSCLTSSIRFLTLAGNNISIVQGLKCLNLLGFLDLSDNLIEDFDIEELPKSLSFVLFKNNKCASLGNYKNRLIQNLPNLKSIDNEMLDDTSDDNDASSDEDQSNEEDLGLVEQTESGDDFTDVCTDLLIRTSSRLDEVIKEHHKRLDLIKDYRKPEVASSSSENQPYKDADKQLMKIGNKMQSLLNKFVEAEKTALNQFELPTPSIRIPSRPSSAHVSSQPEYDDGDNNKRKTTKVINPAVRADVPNGSLASPRLQSSFVSVGTTTGRTATPPTKERLITPSTKTRRAPKYRSKIRTKTKPGAGDDSTNRVLKNTTADVKPVRSVSSSSLVRIPGARPFLKS